MFKFVTTMYMIIVVVAAEYKSYDYTRFETSPGIYFNKLGSVGLYHYKFNVMTYLDVSLLEKVARLLEDLYNKIQESNYHPERRFDLFKQLDALRSKEGYISKGLLSSDLEYKNMLTIIKQNEEKVINKNLYASNLLNHYMQNLIKNINNIDTTNLEKNYQSLYNNQNDVMRRLINTMNDFKTIVNETILTSQIFRYKFHDMIFNFISQTSSRDLYNYDLQEQHMDTIMELMVMDVFYEYNTIIYKISIPLIKQSIYNLYDIIPLPAAMNNNNYVFLQPDIKYLVVDDNKNSYIALKNEDECMLSNASDNLFVCKTEYLMSDVKTAFFPGEERILKLFFKDLQSIREIIYSVKKRFIHITNEFWHNSSRKNQWIYVLPKKINVTVSCKTLEVNNNQSLSKETIQLTGSGLLQLNKDCTGKSVTNNVTLISNEKLLQQYGSFLPEFNIIDYCCKYLNDVKLPTTKNTNDNLLNSVIYDYDTIETLANAVQEGRDETKYYILYVLSCVCICIVIIIVLLVVIFVVVRKTKTESTGRINVLNNHEVFELNN